MTKCFREKGVTKLLKIVGRSSKTKTKKLDLATRKSLEKTKKKKRRRKKRKCLETWGEQFWCSDRGERLTGVGLRNKGRRNGGKDRQ